MNLRRKLETAIVHYLKSTCPAVAQITVVPGHNASEPDMPYIVVHCPNSQADEDLGDQGVSKVTLSILLKSSADDQGERQTPDSIAEALLAHIMAAPNLMIWPSDSNFPGGKILAALNKPAAGPDSRVVCGLHLYDIEPVDDATMFEGSDWFDGGTFEIIAQPYDSH